MNALNQPKAAAWRETKNITKVAVLGVMAFFIMTYLEFPLPLFPAFLKMDLSDLPALLAGFGVGPWAAVLVEVLKNILHAIFKNQTAFVGEAANLLTGILFVVPAALLYSVRKTRLNAILGMAAGTVIMTLGMALANYYVFIPLYAKVFNIPVDAIVGMGTSVNSRVIDLKTLVVYSIVPFNIIKGFMLTAVTMLIYKRVSPLLHM
ncbi:ECF transporter S component [Thermosediminibacter litoriperuensis]|uniref:Riboflavin transporter n=1 Tax=Thermosediminibacter litoriperuensis TaxID=291989 RepID=A0A5S5APB7_9FIRM|nr:ECF transporter S component [Thermosediminibacter litoriperuensis]TYP53311.1 riboflavin transporter FmnP [Thermosediminibacter litoriperuensis]